MTLQDVQTDFRKRAGRFTQMRGVISKIEEIQNLIQNRIIAERTQNFLYFTETEMIYWKQENQAKIVRLNHEINELINKYEKLTK